MYFFIDENKMKKISDLAIFLMLVMIGSCADVRTDHEADRVKTNLTVPYQHIGTILPKSIHEVRNELTLGCEVLDRDYADYQQYKEYLEPLGLKKIRLQGGWAKTEKVKGVYDFAWLDSIIYDATDRGLKIWLQTSYGNPVYEGGGTPYLKGGWPTSVEGKAAWDRWVEALAIRYKGRVYEWEIWNEPDINKEQIVDYKSLTDLNIRTAEIIKKVEPTAKIAALSLALADDELLDKCLKDFQDRGKLDLFDWISYHQYTFRPEDAYPKVEKMREVILRYSDRIKLWQGENGAPSKGYMGGALSAYNWSEVSQAKWALRRMMGDHGRGIATGIFSISDMNYGGNDAIKKKNVKGLLATNDQKKVLRPKMAYYAVQHFAAVFDLLQNQIEAKSFKPTTDYSYSLFAYQDEKTGLQSFLMWYDEATPTNFNQPTPVDIEVMGGRFDNPVWVDLLTGKVYKIPAGSISKKGNNYAFSQIPVYDSPVLIVDMSLIQYK